MALPIRAALRSASRFIATNPRTMLKVARHAVSMRIAVPLDALRWFVENTPPSRKAPTDIHIEADPPAIVLSATVDLMNTKVRAKAAIRVEELRIRPDELRVTLKLSDVRLDLLGDALTPLAGLIKSGALDLSKPGDLAKFMPKRPPVLVEAHGDVIVLDLLKNPTLAANYGLRRILKTLTPVVNVAALETDDDFLILGLRATPLGLPRALSAARV